MKCEKCGAEIPAGYVYCAACGSEARLVPDYNLLDDDILGNMVRHEAGGIYDGNETVTRRRARGRRKARWNHAAIWKIICIVIAVAILTFVFMCQSIQKKQQNSYAYQYRKAEECFAEKKWEEAAGYYRRSLELKPGDKKAKERLSDTCLELNDDDGAIEILEKLFSEDKKNMACMKKLVGLYDKNGEYDKILALAKEAEGSGADRIFADYLVEPPEFSKRPGTYSEALEIAIASGHACDIFYTMDGSDPGKRGEPYEGIISLKKEGSTTLMAVARNEKGIYSEVTEATYTIQYLPPEMPKVEPAGGVYEEARAITVQVPENCTAYYTWDGSDPAEGSPVYAGPLEMQPGNRVLSVMLVNAHGLKSGIYRVNYIYMP